MFKTYLRITIKIIRFIFYNFQSKRGINGVELIRPHTNILWHMIAFYFPTCLKLDGTKQFLLVDELEGKVTCVTCRRQLSEPNGCLAYSLSSVSLMEAGIEMQHASGWVSEWLNKPTHNGQVEWMRNTLIWSHQEFGCVIPVSQAFLDQ